MSESCGAILLAGGSSRRMGSDKVWLRRGGRTLLEATAHEAKAVCDHVVVVARAEQPLPSLPASIVRIDDPAARRHKGPLPATLTGLEWAAFRGIARVFVGACDMPFLSSVHIRFMLDRLGHPPVASAVPIGPGPVVHGLSGALDVSAALPAARRCVDLGRLAMRDLFEVLGGHRLPTDELPDPQAIVSCNTAEEWASLVGAPVDEEGSDGAI